MIAFWIGAVIPAKNISESTAMPFPLQISFHGLDRSEALEANVREHAERLEEFCNRITSGHVVLEKPHRHRHHGNVYHVRIQLAVPRRELVVDREPGKDHAHEDPYVAVRDAFKAIRRQLEDYVREVRGDTKAHATPPHGRIVRLRPESDYGFIETAEGREIYFHRNSVLQDVFEKLEIGDRVSFTEEQGDEGPQACAVRLVADGKYAGLEAADEHGEAHALAGHSRPSPESTDVAREAVQLRAYERWEAAGRPAGDDVRFWLEAERELSQRK